MASRRARLWFSSSAGTHGDVARATQSSAPRSAWLISRRTQLREFSLSLLAASCLLWAHTGQASTSAMSTYRLANIDVAETADMLTFHAQGRRLASARVMPGGALRPEVQLDASGILSIGTQRFDTKTGRAMGQRHITACEAELSKRANSVLRTSASTALLLRRRDDASGRTVAYDSQAYALRGCRLISHQQLTGDQLNLFFEFGSTTQGAWLVGSDERFLLIRPNGDTWRRLSLPEEWGNLLTTQWRSDGAMWVLVNVLQDGALKPTLFHSTDHGHEWQRMGTTVGQVTANWFEATRELSKSMDCACLP